ncbi:MAG: efflux RND transporter permease subunit, partial [Gammaproteobacteria bacterium]|nr:efflux RND transporter permease subunit [Gammaproteobacteria bacterium]
MDRRGIISFFATHRVAGNLLMMLMILFGLYGVSNLNRQIIPTFQFDAISITVQWPGSSPEDVEDNIIQAIEPEVRFLDNVDKVDSVAYAGLADIQIEFEENADMSKALTDVQSAIARITTFPIDIEKPIVNQFQNTDMVCKIEISGPFSEAALKHVAKTIRDDLLDLGMSKARLAGARDSEIWVEISPDVLRRLDMTLADVAERIEAFSLDLPSGTIESGGISRQIRSEAMARSAREVGAIEVLSKSSGEKLRIKDIGIISETFEEGSVSHFRGEEKSVGIWVNRGVNVDSIDAQKVVTQYVEKLRAELPPTMHVELFDVFADQATQRVRMLMTNGGTGLALVLIVLFVFLNFRVAFWVAMGIPIAVMAAFGGMYVYGMSLNMISMFAVIMGLGIIVDDAIVVAEHTEMLHRRGMSPEDATMTAAKIMFAPVLAASLTTIAAFFPILTVGQEVGRIIREMPITVILVIIASLVECFLILPNHLKHALSKMESGEAQRPPSGFKKAFIEFRENRFSRFVTYCFDRRYTTLIAAVCIFLITMTLMVSGRIGFEFFASPETDMVYGNVAMAPGTPRAKTRDMIRELARAASVAEDRLTGGERGLIEFEFGTVGTTEGRQGEGIINGDHSGAYSIQLAPSDDRDVRTYQFLAEWEKEVQPIAGVENLVFFERSAGGPPGRDLDIRLHGAELDVLKAAALEIRTAIMTVPGVTAVEDNLPFGKEEILLELTPAGRAMGFTTQSVARQVRNSYEGAIAKRFSQDQEEIIVRVKLLESAEQVTESLRELYLRTADGDEVPLTEVVSFERTVGYATIRREDGLRQISVTADVDPSITTSNAVLALVGKDIAPQVREKYGINIEFKGKAEEQREALADTGVALLLAVLTMYIILAWVFSSYTTPLIVLAIVPFALVGAFIGHWIMGYRLNMLSLMALLGLSGVMINDAIILVTRVKLRLGELADLRQAVILSACERLRPVILTTLTTIGGLTPLLFEGSIQAQLV